MPTYNLFLRIEPKVYTIESNSLKEAVIEAKAQFAKALRIGDFITVGELTKVTK